MNIADRMQSLRKTKGISQEELADIVGVSRQAVSKWESEQSTPDVEKIILLSDYFDVTTDYLLRGVEPAAEGQCRRDAMLFTLAGTVINAVGLVLAVTVWLERYRSYTAGIGLIVMALGTMVFFVGQLTDSQNRAKAKAVFLFYNIWILLLIPSASCFNILDGLYGGYSGRIAPLPELGNSLVTYGLYWLLYLTVCITADILISKIMRRNAQAKHL